MNALVLLIGSNNIPNYVTAKYLLNPERVDTKELPVPDTLILVFSHDTERFKNSLVDCLKMGTEVSVVDVPLGSDERNHKAIKKELERKLQLNNFSSVHLNYTGGTKVMVLAAYEVVEICCAAKKVYSYLDFKNNKIELSNSDDASFPCEGDLRNWVKLTIEEIFKLHCLDKSITYKTDLNLENSTYFNRENLIQTLSSKQFQKNLEVFEEAERLNKATWKAKERKKYCRILNEMLYNADSDSELNSLIKSLMEAPFNKKEQEERYEKWYVEKFISLLTSCDDIFDEIHYGDFSSCQSLYSFFASVWVEQLVFSVLKKIQEQQDNIGLTGVFWDVEGYSEGREFQIDVIAFQSFNTIVFSCTSSDETSPCKQKAFEANYRAVQIGGEHAKSVLVCLKDNPEADIRNDMAQFEAMQNFSIIGRENLSDRKKLEETIRFILGKQG